MNVILIPKMGYMGSAWANFACYFSMMVISFFWGRKVYKVNYNLLKILSYSLLAVSLYFVSELIVVDNYLFSLLVNSILLIVFVSVAVVFEKRNLKKMPT